MLTNSCRWCKYTYQHHHHTCFFTLGQFASVRWIIKFCDILFIILVYLGQLPEELLVLVLCNKYTEKLWDLNLKVGNSWTKHKTAKGLFYRMVQNVPLMKNFDQKVLSLKLTWTLISLHFVLIMPACKCLSDWNGWSIRRKWHARDRRGKLKLLVRKENFLSHDHTDKPRERKAHILMKHW